MSDMMVRGLELVLLGMGTVFVFLTALVAATMLMSRIILAMTPVPVEVEIARAAVPAGSDRRLIAVISAAIGRYRADHVR